MNEALRNALAAKGIDRLDVAAKLQVDPKTVERWLAGRLPHPSTRTALARLLDMDEQELWPAADNPHARRFGPEIRAVYPHRWAVPRDIWHQHFASAEHEIDILVYSGLFLFEDAGVLQLLASKADAGVRIRILLGDPESAVVAQRGEDEGIGDSMAARICNAQALLKPLVTCDTTELRFHRTTLYNSLFRADNRLLANAHIHGVNASAAPILHLCHSAHATLFSTYIASFERAWQDSKL
ncbi:XRE family transcriptional regulator [Actinospica sp. MGRD01-02]|uniref:XRE family transcriptional regulator n=1 Tax=Actinospica acidithermotolerans TaxID=2828514 RepID=A0A941EF76_9ACTN|nr:XRE family transcriptional regulator [Actinospica acidithermotolerans]MBR7830256.1 XRE family transcriptional regulator [Actinospica acidithermotolerans]